MARIRRIVTRRPADIIAHMNTAQDAHKFNAGDIVKVFTRNLRDEKVSPAVFEGIVIAKRGDGENKTFTVRKNASTGVAVERIYPENSPSIVDIKLIKKGKVRRAKLYYLRNSK